MKIDKIEIQTPNKKYATDINILVDKIEFLKEIKRLRDKWDIRTLYKVSNLDVFLASDNVQKRLPEFEEDIDMILKKFNRGKNFRLVLEYALVTGIVPDGIYQSCYVDVVTINQAEDLSKPEQYQYVIVMSPRTEKKEVEKAYKEFREHIKEKIKFHSHRIPLDSPVTKEFQDALECIKREEKIYQEGIKDNNTLEELSAVFMQYLENTKEARSYMLTIGELDGDIPDHRDLIEQYHNGNVYSAANIDKFKTQKELERARDWHWIQYDDYMNGLSDAPLLPAEVCKIWQDRCPINKGRKFKGKEECECIYCIDPVIIMKALTHYDNLLKYS